MKAYIDEKRHFYLQREKDVLHISDDLTLINILPAYYLKYEYVYLDGSKTGSYTEISLDLFKEYHDIAIKKLSITNSNNE